MVYDIPQNLIDNFSPTWLYLKQHTETGLLYFGKTTEDDPYSYPGSGKYWSRHLKKHGNASVTHWALRFDDIFDLVHFAITFSKQNDIVESTAWANLREENGLDGMPKGFQCTSEHRANVSKSKKGLKVGPCKDPEAKKAKQSASLSGPKNPRFGKTGTMANKQHSLESLAKIQKHAEERGKDESYRQKCRDAIRPTVTCPHCGIFGALSIMKRWHLDKCRNITSTPSQP